VDDILDVTADSATLGKTAGKDAAQDKPTYVSLLGLAPRAPMRRRLLRRPWRAGCQRPAPIRAPCRPALADMVVNRNN
jgi:farnesyl diphosphate synthase